MKKILSIFLLIALALGGTVKADELVVANDTWEKDKLPIDSYNCDAAQHNQFIYPASELQDMKGAVISGIKFHTVKASYSWSSAGSPVFTFKFAEVEATTLSGFITEASFTQVYQGTAVFASNAWDITFDAGYTYNGGNLLIDVESPKAGYISTVKFYSAEYANAGCANGTGHSYLPKATFTYEIPVSGPGLKVADGTTKIASGYEYNFGLALAGATKTFTLSNPGTAATPVSVAHTGDFGAVLSAASIPAGEEITLTVTMPAASGSDVITISSTEESIADFVINVTGTIRDANKLWCNFADGLPEDWTNDGFAINTSGAGEGTTGGGYAGQTAYSFKRLSTPLLKFTEGEKLYLLVAGSGTTASWNSMDIQYSADGTNWTTAKTVSNIVKGSWTSVEVTEIPAGNYYIGFNARYAYVTDIYGGSYIKRPKDIVLNSKTTNSLTLGWTPAGSETAWKVEYSTNSDMSSSTIVGADSDPFELTGLSANTKYYVRVKANAEDAEWSDVAGFRTECGTITIDAEHSWTENFEGEEVNAAPSCWEFINATATSLSTYPHIAVRAESGYYKDSKSLHFRNNTTKLGYAIFPVIENLNHSQITFSHIEESTSNGGFLTLGYLTNIADASTFTPLFECTPTTSFKEEDGISLSSVPSGARLAFQYQVKTSYYDAAVDNITISLAPACVKPSEVKATSLDSVSANITWTNGGEETSWKLRYSTDNENWTVANEGNAFTTKPYELTGLKASTTYYVQVAAVCGVSDESEWSVAGSFTTDCNAADELNEAFSSSLPDCWKAEATDANGWKANSSYKVSATYSMYYYASSSTENYADLITPNVNLGDKESNLTFYLKNDGYYGAVTAEVYIVVGASTTKLVDLGATSGWALQTIDLSAYAGKIAKFIFRAHGLGAYSSIYIDDVAISVKPCNKPTGLAAAASKGSATITWTDEEADKWNLHYRVVGAEDWIDSLNLTAKTKLLEGLDEEAEYEVQVQAVCSATRSSDWTASVKFKPVCPTPGAITITDKTYNSATASWTAGGAETAWNVQIKEGEGEYGASIPVTEPTYALAGLNTGTQYSIRVQAACGGDWSAVANYTPAYTEPEVAAATSITETSATVAWGAVADAAGYEVALTLRGVAASEWKATTKTDTTFSNLAAKTDYDVFVRAKYDTGESTADSIGFSTIAVAPTDLVQGTTTTESISFSWSYAGAATQFQYKVNDGDWSAPQTALTATVNGLNSGTTYTIYVRAYYADGKESSELSESFATECAVKALGWSENFEASSSIPACWEGGSDVTIAASSGVSNSNALRLRAYSAVQAATPEINISEAAVLNFSYQSSSATGAVYINSVAEENKVATLSTSTKFKEVSVDLAAYNGQDIKVIFYGNSTGYNRYIYIDNVEVVEKPCAAISNLTATAALDSVVLAWESDAEAFEYCVVEGSAEAAGWLPINAKTVTVKGLTPETAYTAYVRSSCSETKKGEASGKAFTPACPAPTAAEASEVTTTTAKLSWTAAAGITHYQYKLNDEDWVAEHVVEGASVELSALTPGTAYKFYVRSYYSAAVQSTATSVDFTTECAAQALPFNEDFSGAITCWTLVDCHNDSKVSGGVFQFNFNSNPPQYLISPELVPSEKNVKVQFEYKAKNSTWEESFQVGYSTTTKETTAFTWSDTTFCNVTDYQEYSDVLPAGVRFIAIKYTADDKDHLYIDNFSATETSEATAIDNIGAGIKSDAIKYMENGVLYIIRDGIKYNAQGAQVSK